MNISKGSRRARAGLAAVTVCIAVGGVTLGTQAAQADPLPLTPTLNCVAAAGGGADIAYFGYDNAGPVSISLALGDGNQVVPGILDQGQPIVFNVGSYPSVFRVEFNPVITPVVSWVLNGLEVDADDMSPQCSAGITAPASGVSATAATLNGVLTPGGTDTTYTFDYGTTPAYGSSTTVTDGGSGDAAELVQAALTGLTPSTTYYFRLDTTNGFAGTVDGQQQTFTTPAPPAPAGMTLATTALPAGTAGASIPPRCPRRAARCPTPGR